MRRLVLLLTFASLLAVPASATAAVTTTNDAATLAGALGAGSAVTGASLPTLPPSGTPHGIGDAALGGFPTEGSSFAILTSGDASLADTANGGDGDGTSDAGATDLGFAGAPGNADDTSVLKIDLNVPEGSSCLSFNVRFLTEEYPENVGKTVNDGFVAELDAHTVATDPSGDISAPDNFAFDQNGALLSVNTASLSDTEAAGTTYDGATTLQTVRHSVAPGPHSLYLTIFDQGDDVFDSAAFVDNLTFSDLTGAECNQVVDRIVPAVTVATPASGSQQSDSPTFSGSAGTAATDSQFVSVQVYSGPTVSGEPVDVVTASQADGTWQAGSSGLPLGQYTVQAHQTDKAGNVGVSAPKTFTVSSDSTPPVVQITSPHEGDITADTTPTISGTAGADPGDAPGVDVTLHSGGANGSVVQALTVRRDGTAWSIDADALDPGAYTVIASQTDTSENVGTSTPVSFTVSEPGPTATPTPEPTPTPPPPGPAPVLGRSVVAGVVSGTVKVKGKNGKFHTLGAGQSIPLGSTVDATKGRVRITSAAGAGKTQTGDFYQGAFVITQTKAKKPITQLALSGKLSCGTTGKASAAAKKKKVRRLWGDGHGSFRTKGRSGAATVRGTKWLTEDRCNGTLVRVKRGVVQVRDFAKRKTVTVKKGHSYLARAKVTVKKRH